MDWKKTFINRVFKGLFLFMVPVILLIFVFEKAVNIVQNIISPIREILPEERIFGIGVFTLISLFTILLICYVFGFLAERKKIKVLLKLIDEVFSLIIPGYTVMKSRANEAIGLEEQNWNSVLIGDDGDWKIGIEVSKRADGLSMVFFPEPPDGKSGELKLIPQSKLKPLDMPASKIMTIIRKYGKDMDELL
ncbi:hypothetical protein EF405_04030 [Cyclobacteriaceae bacterium YHN15]|nr:hypothetical protein EF405_04030 [Cyclobacteriaceae bacterium YHN15]